MLLLERRSSLLFLSSNFTIFGWALIDALVWRCRMYRQRYSLGFYENIVQNGLIMTLTQMQPLPSEILVTVRFLEGACPICSCHCLWPTLVNKARSVYFHDSCLTLRLILAVEASKATAPNSHPFPKPDSADSFLKCTTYMDESFWVHLFSAL